MPYYPNLSRNPITVLALWDRQVVEVCDQKMTFVLKPNSDKVFLTTGDPDNKAYDAAWKRHMNGELGHAISPPIYSEYHRHVRRGPISFIHGQAEFTREELTSVLAGDYYIG